MFQTDLKWMKECQPTVISELHKLYPNAKIEPTSGGGELDKEMSVDLKVTFPDRVEIWAMKFRRKKFWKMHDVTIEILNGDGTLGDWYRFKGGVVKKYVYGWFDNKHILELLVLDVAKLMGIQVGYFKGRFEREFPGGLRIGCYRNLEHGLSHFTTINIDTLLLLLPETILHRIKTSRISWVNSQNVPHRTEVSNTVVCAYLSRGWVSTLEEKEDGEAYGVV